MQFILLGNYFTDGQRWKWRNATSAAAVECLLCFLTLLWHYLFSSRLCLSKYFISKPLELIKLPCKCVNMIFLLVWLFQQLHVVTLATRPSVWLKETSSTWMMLCALSAILDMLCRGLLNLPARPTDSGATPSPGVKVSVRWIRKRMYII